MPIWAPFHLSPSPVVIVAGTAFPTLCRPGCTCLDGVPKGCCWTWTSTWSNVYSSIASSPTTLSATFTLCGLKPPQTLARWRLYYAHHPLQWPHLSIPFPQPPPLTCLISQTLRSHVLAYSLRSASPGSAPGGTAPLISSSKLYSPEPSKYSKHSAQTASVLLWPILPIGQSPDPCVDNV